MRSRTAGSLWRTGIKALLSLGGGSDREGEGNERVGNGRKGGRGRKGVAERGTWKEAVR